MFRRKRWFYRYRGLDVASEIEFPELNVFGVPHLLGEPDVNIRLELTDASGDISSAGMTGSARQVRLSVPGTGIFEIVDGRDISVAPRRGIDQANLRPFVLGSAWAILSKQRGDLILHASAINKSNRAFIFCGGSGKGKSTLAATVMGFGPQIVADDVCAVTIPMGGVPHLYPAPPLLKLWRETVDGLGLGEVPATPDPFRNGKSHLLFPQNSSRDPLPVKTIYLLSWGALKIERLSGLDALQSFLSEGRYRSDFPSALNDAHLAASVRLLSTIPVYRFTRPLDLKANSRSVRFLMDSLEE